MRTLGRSVSYNNKQNLKIIYLSSVPRIWQYSVDVWEAIDTTYLILVN